MRLSLWLIKHRFKTMFYVAATVTMYSTYLYPFMESKIQRDVRNELANQIQENWQVMNAYRDDIL